MTVLVAFATSRGSTRGIAARVADRLRRRGLSVDLKVVTDVDDIEPYDAIVLGSAIHGGKWLPEASSFVRLHAACLRDRPAWLFSVSTLGDDESMFPPRVAASLRAMRKQTPELAAFRESIHPRGHRDFAGAVARGDWPARGRAFFRAMGGRYGDHRNWPAIDAWADRIGTDLLATPAGPEADTRTGQPEAAGH